MGRQVPAGDGQVPEPPPRTDAHRRRHPCPAPADARACRAAAERDVLPHEDHGQGEQHTPDRPTAARRSAACARRLSVRIGRCHRAVRAAGLPAVCSTSTSPADPRQVTGGDEPRHDRPFSSRLPVRADERRSGGEEERRSGGAEERRQVPCRVDSELSELGVRTVRGPITLPCQVNAGPGDPPVAWCLRRSRSGGGSRPQQGPVPAQQRHAAGRRPPTGTRAAPPAPGPTAGPRRRC